MVFRLLGRSKQRGLGTFPSTQNMEFEMKPSNRILLAGIVIETMLGGLGGYLVMQISRGAMTTRVSPAEAIANTTTVLGTAMGALGGLLLVIFIVLRRRGS
jgi:hypothetical protein